MPQSPASPHPNHPAQLTHPHPTHRRCRTPLPSSKLTVLMAEDGWSCVVRRSHVPSRTANTPDRSGRAAKPDQPNQAVESMTTILAQTSLKDLSENLTPAQLSCYHFLQDTQSSGGGGGGREKKGDVSVEERLWPKVQAARCTERELKARYEKIRGAWRESGGRRAMTGLLKGVLGGGEEEGKQQKIKKLLCLGLGSPSADASGWRCVVMWQLVVFLDLGEMFFPNTPLYAQDPIFNDLDITFLASFSITVIPTPLPDHHSPSPVSPSNPSPKSSTQIPQQPASQAPPSTTKTSQRKMPGIPQEPPTTTTSSQVSSSFTGKIDKDTLVYAPHFPIAYWTPGMRQGEVGVVIGNDVTKGLERIPTPATLRTLFSPLLSGQDAEQDIPDLHIHEELTAFLSSHSMAAWPEPEECVGGFNDMVVYWREG